MNLTLSVMPGLYAVCRFDPGESIPAWAWQGDFVTVSRTPEELSVLCAEGGVPEDVQAERGWRCLKLAGPFDFALTGVLASVLGPLAEARISILAVSTFDTDYVLVRADRLEQALHALREAGHTVR
jgi:uncharacterized protein